MEKQLIIEAIDQEISDRELAQYDTTDEVVALNDLLSKVKADQPLVATEYQWVAYCVSALIESQHA